MPVRPAEPDHAAPVVDRQGHLRERQVLHQVIQVVDTAAQTIGVLRIAGLVGLAAAHVVDRYDAMGRRQSANQATPIERPRRVAVDHEHHRAITRSFVDVVKAHATL